MHLLDIIVYLFVSIIISKYHNTDDGFIDKLIRFIIWLGFSLFYVILFGVFDLNWCDLLNFTGYLTLGKLKILL